VAATAAVEPAAAPQADGGAGDPSAICQPYVYPFVRSSIAQSMSSLYIYSSQRIFASYICSCTVVLDLFFSERPT